MKKILTFILANIIYYASAFAGSLRDDIIPTDDTIVS
jgi:hypothetical protein